MKILVFGATGQLGRSMNKVFERLQGNVEARQQLKDVVLECVPRSVDISVASQVSDALRAAEPAWVVNAAAMTDVDGAHAAPSVAMNVNAMGVANLASASTEMGARLIHVSTEAVFDGERNKPYGEGDACMPVSTYGASKLAGEMFARIYAPDSFILRTSWLYSRSATVNFPTRLLDQLASHDRPVNVVTDVVGNPTPSNVLAEAILALVRSPIAAGTYHVCCIGEASKYEWAIEIARQAGFDVRRIEPADSSSYPTIAKRPKHVNLDCSKFLATGIADLPTWQEAWRTHSSL
jgi:dTDP-4-dehydrorhamnose reductase